MRICRSFLHNNKDHWSILLRLELSCLPVYLQALFSLKSNNASLFRIYSYFILSWHTCLLRRKFDRIAYKIFWRFFGQTPKCCLTNGCSVFHFTIYLVTELTVDNSVVLLFYSTIGVTYLTCKHINYLPTQFHRNIFQIKPIR